MNVYLATSIGILVGGIVYSCFILLLPHILYEKPPKGPTPFDEDTKP